MDQQKVGKSWKGSDQIVPPGRRLADQGDKGGLVEGHSEYTAGQEGLARGTPVDEQPIGYGTPQWQGDGGDQADTTIGTDTNTSTETGSGGDAIKT